MRVLLTGAQEFLGKLVLARLRKRSEVSLILTVGPEGGVRGLKTRSVKLALNDPKIAELVREEDVDTIVHLDLRMGKTRSEGNFEHTVMGSMTLLAAAAEAGARKVVLRSTAELYGARHTNPAFIDEGRRIRLTERSSYLRDLADVERNASDFRKSFPEVIVTILRFAHMVGPTATTPFMRYVRMGSPPIISGFDPLFQLLHEEDAADAVMQAVCEDVRGPVNVAPDGVVPLLRVLRFLGCSYLAAPPILTGLSRRFLPPMRELPMDPSFLKLSCCVDNGRMKQELGFLPKRTSSATLKELKEGF